ncbi:MAG: class I SAM-dependent methyltransferase [Deltaproteobacteria bacterium]
MTERKLKYEIYWISLGLYLLKRKARSIIGAMACRLVDMYQERRLYHEKIARYKNIMKMNQLGKEFDQITHYDNDYSIDVWNQYCNEAKSDGLNDTKAIFDGGIKMFQQLIELDPKIRRVLNFGVMYGGMDYRLATLYPEIEFHGIDLAEPVRILNTHAFHARNLKFHTGQIQTFLKDQSESFDLFIHTRTAPLLQPVALEQLYSLLSKNGIRYVLLQEPTGYSERLRRFYNFSKDQESEFYDGNMLIHNYPLMLKKQHYQILSSALVKAPHPYRSDMHFIQVTAKSEGTMISGPLKRLDAGVATPPLSFPTDREV